MFGQLSQPTLTWLGQPVSTMTVLTIGMMNQDVMKHTAGCSVSSIVNSLEVRDVFVGCRASFALTLTFFSR